MKIARVSSKVLVAGFACLVLGNCGKSEQKDDPDPVTEIELEPPTEIAADIGSSEIPYIVINTSQNIKNEPKVPATLHVLEDGQWTHNEYIGIEYRGSTSFRLTDKKSFGIETKDENFEDMDVSFFGFPEEEDWVLNGHIIGDSWDNTLMHHYLAYTLYREMGNYASRTKFVEVEVDGDYRGVYVFMEKLKRDVTRINIARNDEDVSGGYILKIDKAAGGDLGLLDDELEEGYFENNWNDDATYQENFCFRSNYDVFGQSIDFPPFSPPYENTYLETYFIYDYPRKDDITSGQKTYIQDYINDFETALLSDNLAGGERTYADYIDINSFVDMFIINELCRNVDGYRLSTFLYKDAGQKLNIGPPWDFNIGFAKGGRIPVDRWVIDYNEIVGFDAWMMPFWWSRFMEDAVFKSAVKTRWQALRAGPLSTANIHSIIQDRSDYLTSNGAIARNDDKWGDFNHADAVLDLKNFITERSNWMDQQISGF